MQYKLMSNSVTQLIFVAYMGASVAHLVEPPASGGGSVAFKLVALEDGEGELLGSESESDY
jgi:hypothetical protein